MAKESGLVSMISFLDKLGIYDVVLPFLLVFTLVFAILEKTKILGVDKIEGVDYTKKNLNAIVAFVTGFLVIASTSLVRAINEIVANVVLVVILLVSFMMLIGIMFGDKEVSLQDYKGWMKFFMVVIFIAILMILLQALGFLEPIIGIFLLSADTDWAAAITVVLFVIAFIWLVTWDFNKKKETKDE